MSKYRVLLYEKLEHHARPLLNDAGIKADAVSTITRARSSGEEQVFLIDQVFQSRRKPFIINTARDALIHEEASLSALKEGRIRGTAFALPESRR